MKKESNWGNEDNDERDAENRTRGQHLSLRRKKIN